MGTQNDRTGRRDGLNITTDTNVYGRNRLEDVLLVHRFRSQSITAYASHVIYFRYQRAKIELSLML